jgi:hypothetical protein
MHRRNVNHRNGYPLSVVSGMERSGFPETSTVLKLKNQPDLSVVSGMERSGFPETSTLLKLKNQPYLLLFHHPTVQLMFNNE